MVRESNARYAVDDALGAVELGGERWRIVELTPSDGGASPGYTCVSYSWGQTQDHVWSSAQRMSMRALRAAATVIDLLQPEALWLDAFCLPLDGGARAECLRRLGEIYAQAQHVVVVLSEACGAVLGQIHQARAVDEAGLRLFEADEWVSRVWTYQEVVNSRKLDFVAEGRKEKPVDGQEFLNHVGHALGRYKDGAAKTGFDMHVEFPRTDALENLMADWLMAGYLERPAYQIMSSMHDRVAQQPDDYFHAALGAVAGAVDDAERSPELPPAEVFMRACEKKGDFSFVYAAAPRSVAPGPRWRPVPGPLPALFPWHTFGVGQRGTRHERHVTLEGMWRVPLEPIDEASLQALRGLWRSPGDPVVSAGPNPEVMLALLRRGGFAGGEDCIELRHGYFFPMSKVGQPSSVVAAVCTGLRWARGALGLLLRARGSEPAELVTIGLFVGAVPEKGEAIDIAD